MAASKYVGALDPVSLFVRFNFTQGELLQATQRWIDGTASGVATAKPTELATYVHELTHYLQYTTTSYGIYLQYCRQLQNAATIDLIRSLPANASKPPIGWSVPSGSGPDADRARTAWTAWWCIENFIAAISADRDRRIAIRAMFDNLAGKPGPTSPGLLDLPTTFNHIQHALADHLRGRISNVPVDSIMDAITGRNPQRMLDAIFLKGSARGDLWKALVARPRNTDLAADKRQFEQDVTSYPWSAEAIIEGAALAAELWDSDITMPRLQKWLSAKVSPAKDVYRACLRKAFEAVKTTDASQFLLSFMTLSELVLQAPLLPAHATLRGASHRFEEILPAWRFEVLVAAAADVAPMQGREDYTRYVADLCRRAGLTVSPVQSGQIDCAMPDIRHFPLASVYRSAQRLRADHPSSMIGIDRLLVLPNAFAAEWRSSFNFVILDYADKTTFHKDKPFMNAMTDAYLSTLVLRWSMLDGSPVIPSPYGRSDAEDRYMTDYANDCLTRVAPPAGWPRIEIRH